MHLGQLLRPGLLPSLTLGVTGTLPVTLLPRDDWYESVPLAGNVHDMVRLPISQPGLSLPRAA